MYSEMVQQDKFDSKAFRQRYTRRKDDFRNDIVLEVVPYKSFKRNFAAIKKPDVLSTYTSSSMFNHISNDIWFHISKHIEPENVKKFALICRQTAALVRTKHFWKTILQKYCSKFLNPSLLNLNWRSCEMTTLRLEVIKLLFSCYKPFIRTIQLSYSLDWLNGRLYVSSWYKQCECVWIMCYKFWNQVSTNSTDSIAHTVNDWESLADEDFKLTTKVVNSFEGVVLLVISCNSYVPFPSQLLYDNCKSEGYARLVATRQLLTKDIVSINLELDFQSTSHELKTTVRYPSILKYKVLPWWHPEFQAYVE